MASKVPDQPAHALLPPMPTNMSPHADHSSSLEEQLSHNFDHEKHDRALVTEIGDEQAEVLTNAWQQIGDHLRALPTKTVRDVAAQVQAEIRPKGGTDSSTPPAKQPLVPTRNLGRSVALLATSCAVMVVAATIVAFQANTDFPATAIAFRAADAQDWEVVVVTVPDQRMNLVTDKLRNAVDERGLSIHTLNQGESATGESVELLMASSESSIEFLDALNADAQDVETEWNPDRVGDVDREDLLRRFSESMQTPTRSDNFFGEIFVILPKDRSIRVKRLTPATTPKDHNPSVADANSSVSDSDLAANTEDSVDAQVAKLLQKKSNRPVLVIFRRKPATSNLQGQLPRSAAELGQA